MLLLGLHTCLNCGSFFVRPDLLCRHCEGALLAADFCQLELSTEKSLPVYSLFEWQPGQSDALSRVFKALKGAKHPLAWRQWAKIFWMHRSRLLGISEGVVFVPAANTEGSVDHAYLFAEALMQLSGGELWNPLRKMTAAHQKEQNREQRSGVVIQSTIKISHETREKRYVFCDDVLTTGSTALASYLALGKPVNFEVWVLGKRSLACGVSVDLL